MPLNPYAGNDPRWWEWEQRERLQQQLRDQSAEQAKAAKRAEEMALDQSIQLEEQSAYLRELAKPQRQRQAILDAAARQRQAVQEKARQEQLARWQAESPPEVRRASKEIKTLEAASFPSQPLTANEVLAFTWLVILVLISCVGFGYVLIGHMTERIRDSQEAAIMVPIGLLWITVWPAGLVAGRQSREKAAWTKKIATRKAELQRTINSYFQRRQTEAASEPGNVPEEPSNQECPFCRETIKAGAKKCRHCGELL